MNPLSGGSSIRPSWFGRFAYHALPFRRQIVLENMRTAFGGELSDEQIKKLAQKFYGNLWLTLLENIQLGWMNSLCRSPKPESPKS